jgi:hypothetical protein
MGSGYPDKTDQDPLAAAAANKLSDINQYFPLFTLLYHHPFELAS